MVAINKAKKKQMPKHKRSSVGSNVERVQVNKIQLIEKPMKEEPQMRSNPYQDQDIKKPWNSNKNVKKVRAITKIKVDNK